MLMAVMRKAAVPKARVRILSVLREVEVEETVAMGLVMGEEEVARALGRTCLS